MAGQPNPYYMLQCSFATGEISKEVANRVDLDKYQGAMTLAENCLIRPYGPVYKRDGMLFVASARYNTYKSKLVPFASGEGYDYVLEFGVGYLRVYKYGELKLTTLTPYTEDTLPKLRFTQSADTMFIASGDFPLKKLVRISDAQWRLTDYDIEKPYFDDSLGEASEDCSVAPSGSTGDITLTASEALFETGMVGAFVRLKQDVASTSVHLERASIDGTSEVYSDSVYVGESWKIITHNTWAGTVEVQYSTDNQNWHEYRKYSSNKDYNATESGTLSEPYYLRVKITCTDGTCTIDLTALPYAEEGYAKITGFTNARNVSATVIKRFGNTEATKQWALSSWCEAFGYPRTVAFFQDRLCLGGNKKQPYMLWMSRTGDYNNFSVQKESGTVTDDSAVVLSFVSRKQFEILHLVPHTDLVVMTSGNEWILSGNEIVSPHNATPKMQTTRGCNDVEPIIIGNRMVFVQGRGSVVRDLGYSYETDSYGGNDLTLLAKQIVRGHSIIDAAYLQEPNSNLYFVREDGTLAVLAYIIDQKIYGWSTVKTDGVIESICAVQEGDVDYLYCIVYRNRQRYIEKFQGDIYTDNPDDYVAVDSAVIFDSTEGADTFTAVNLANRKVTALGDGQLFENLQVDDEGVVKLPCPVKHVVIGLPYAMRLELPNVEMKTGDGTMQGRFKVISNVVLRLYNTLGGMVGPDANTLDDITYDEYLAVGNKTLYSGDKPITLPVGGFEKDGRVFIYSDEPYPFNLLAVVKAVSFGG